VSGLFGDTPGGHDGPSPDETALIPTARPPAQGRARVVQSTFVSDTDDDSDDEDRDSRFAARGQARVVVITDARPAGDAAGSVPAQRPSDDERADEEQHSGE
jgi:hypothetical protein